MKYFRLLSLIVCAALLTMPTTQVGYAQSSGNLLNCQTELRGGYTGCSLRMPAGYTAKSISAKKLNGDAYSRSWRLLDAEDLRDNTKVDMSGTLILVDVSTSSPTRRANFKRNEIPAIKALVEAMPRDELVALSVFGGDLKELVPFTRDRTQLMTALDELELTETNTLIRLNLSEAMKLVAAQTSFIFGSVVLVSDGMEEPTDEPLQSKLELLKDLVQDAKAKRISVSVMGSFWQGRGSPDIAAGRTYLSAISEGTGGEFEAVEYGKPNEVDGRVSQLAGKLRSVRTETKLVVLRDGEAAEPALVQVEIERPVALGSSQTVEETLSDDFSPEQVSPDEPISDDEVTPGETPAEVEEKTPVEQAIELAKTYWYALVAAGVLLLLLLILALRKRGGGDDAGDLGEPEEDIDLDDTGETIIEPVAPVAPAVVGMLVDKASGRQIQINPGRTSLGRGNKNDVVIVHKSVSRAHAVIQSNGEGSFQLSDLQSLNGTFVNGSRITETTPVGFGDTIVLGEYNMVLQKS